MYIINEKDFFDYEEKILLVNYLTGACDVIDSELKIKIKNQRFNLIEQNIMKKLLDRGYVFENKKKCEEYIQNLDTKISIKEKEIVPNFLLIPS